MRISTQLFVLFTLLLLSACGFHLRGQAGMPFSTLYIDAANPNSALITDLRSNLTSNNVKLVDNSDQAEVILSIVSETPGKKILSLGGSGRINEFQLSYSVSLRAYDLKQQEWIPAEEVVLRRDFSYNDSQVLAKQAEETLLYQNMRSDMTQQILRRLSRAHPLPQ